jgi:DNA-directed RNA polymerase specialized sigma24 family protein
MTDSENEKSTERKPWQLNQEALDALLSALDVDRETAGRKYQALHRKLVEFFTWERSESPEALADETMNRLARRLLDGAEISSLDRYAAGIARLIKQEGMRARRTREDAIREIRALSRGAVPEPEKLEQIRRCLRALPKESREVIERYYAEDRASLARSMGLSLNALRNRAHRIRAQLYRCVSGERDDS